MLRKIRIILAALFFTGLLLLFLDFTGTLHSVLGWMSKIQFWPAFLALNVAVLVFLVVLTLIFGRVYCSVICPLGITQDIISWLSGKRKGKKARFTFSSARNILRYSFLGLFILLFALVSTSVAVLLEPYSAFGRIAYSFLSPLYVLVNNLLALGAEHIGSYAFYRTEVIVPSISVIAAASISFVLVFVLSWKNGRTYCNTICPVGTILGLLSRWSLLGVRVDKSKCNGCGICSRKCKASCIGDSKVDYSRCVACMDCIGSCNQKAISYGLKTKLKPCVNTSEKVSEGRRSTLSILSFLAISGLAKAAKADGVIKADGGLADIKDKVKPKTRGVIVPAGSRSITHFTQHCVACQQCVTACPSKILKPSMELENFMQPQIEYENGYCRFDCNKCDEVCPTGAIRPLSLADKSSTQIGFAVWRRGHCIVMEGKSCGNCARHCPTGAIKMEKTNPADPNSIEIPVINKNRCIGCGACEYVCPSRPKSAIYVKGYSIHQTI